MRLLALLVWVWTGILACATMPEDKPEPDQTFEIIEDVFIPYVAEFEKLGDLYAAHVSIQFGEIKQDNEGGTILAYCYYSTNNIVVNPKSWVTLSAHAKEILIFHELGHCVLGREHDDRLDENKCAVTIMHSNIAPSRRCYKKKREYYLQELFK